MERLEVITWQEWRDLAPDLQRHRAIIEALTRSIVLPEQMIEYLLKVADMTGMEVLGKPYADTAHEMGYGGWLHWKASVDLDTSGITVYSYPRGYSKPPLVTVDIYTCKAFDLKVVVDYTSQFFDVTEIVAKTVE